MRKTAEAKPYRSKPDPNPLLVQYFRECKTAGWFLDIGCNTGTELRFMATHGYQCEGVDIDSDTLDICREKLRQEHVTNVTTIEMPAQDFLVHTKRRYDVICCWNVLPFLTSNEAEAVLKGIADRLAFGGMLFLRVFMDKEESAKYPEDGPRHLFFLPTLHSYFPNFQVYKSCQEIVDDEGHVGRPEPHEHFVCTLILRRFGV